MNNIVILYKVIFVYWHLKLLRNINLENIQYLLSISEWCSSNTVFQNIVTWSNRKINGLMPTSKIHSSSGGNFDRHNVTRDRYFWRWVFIGNIKAKNSYSQSEWLIPYLYSWHKALWWGKTLGQLFEVDLRECIIEISVAPMGKPYDKSNFLISRRQCLPRQYVEHLRVDNRIW